MNKKNNKLISEPKQAMEKYFYSKLDQLNMLRYSLLIY